MSFINHIDVTLVDPVADIGQARNRYKIEDGNRNGRYRLSDLVQSRVADSCEHR
jgi:hypothetical protein